MPFQPRLSPDEQIAVQTKHELGWTIDALAAYYGVSRRTIYRCLEGHVVNVKVGNHVAPFRIREDRKPQQIGHWRDAA